MKHLKSYEKYDKKDFLSKLKTYIVTYINNIYYIDEIKIINVENITIENKYVSDLSGADNNTIIDFDYFYEYMVFTSDNLDECYRYIDLRNASDKYNL